MDEKNPYKSPGEADNDSAVRIKIYGLFWLTRGTYLSLEIAGFVFLGALFLAWLGVSYLPLSQRIFGFKYLPWVLAVTAVLELGEMLIVLRKFRVKEAQRAVIRPPTTSSSGEETSQEA